MKKSLYLILVILLLVSASVYLTYSYFLPKVISNDINDVNVSSGSLELRIDDIAVSSLEISPIYDNDYEMLAYNKDFEVISDSTLNACAKLYLRINNISDTLKSEYFKYRLVSDGVDKTGDFILANNGEDMLILDNLYIEGKSTKFFDLYLWISYQDDVDQMNMLSTQIDASLVVKGIDARNSNNCSL